MLELLSYLRANGFKTFVVSGGGIEFMRPWVEKVYGIPPEQVVGSSGAVKFQIGANGKPELQKLPKVEFIDDARQAGRHQPLHRPPSDLAFGNSDGDLQMLQWRRRARAPALWGSSITPMPIANTPTTAIEDRQARQGVGRGDGEGLDGRRHEEGLGKGFSGRQG